MGYQVKQWHHTGGYRHVLRLARMMDKNLRAAAAIRIRFLEEQNAEFAKFDHPVARYWTKENQDEIDKLLIHSRFVYNDNQNSNAITDEMIERARTHPIENLIDFNKDKAYAWCHEDSRPSLSHWKKGNKATCFVCDKKFDPIAVLMQRDGYSFPDAVRALQ